MAGKFTVGWDRSYAVPVGIGLYMRGSRYRVAFIGTGKHRAVQVTFPGGDRIVVTLHYRSSSEAGTAMWLLG